jgi:hypothetical protein
MRTFETPLGHVQAIIINIAEINKDSTIYQQNQQQF